MAKKNYVNKLKTSTRTTTDYKGRKISSSHTLSFDGHSETKTIVYKKPRHLTNLTKGTYLSTGFTILKIIMLILLIGSITSFLFSGNGEGKTFSDFFVYLINFPGVSSDWITNPHFLSIDGTGFYEFLDLIGFSFFWDWAIGSLKLLLLLVTLVLNALSFLTHLLLYFTI